MFEQTNCILVGVPSTERFAETPALNFAIDLAKGCKGTLSIYAFAPIPDQPVPGVRASTWTARERERAEKLTSRVARSASELISRAGVEFVAEHARSPFEPLDARFVQLARVHDITVLDAAGAEDTTQRTVIEDVLFDSGRAVVVIPRHGGTSLPHRVAIAWDGSARSARAVKDALPLLIAAEAVIAVTVTGEKNLSRMAPGADLAMYLTKHGVADCKLAMLAGAGGGVAERLRLFVAEEEIDMLVMGAFVHSRFREAILGGVTRSLLDNAPLPLFMAH